MVLVLPAFCQETEDSQIFISGFNAYQQKDFSTAIDKMNEVLQKYPDTPLRDMALFWLSRSYFKSGNQQDAARFMSQFSKEYPDNPLKGTVEEELLNLVTRYDKGETLSKGSQPAKVAEKQAPQKAKTDKERAAKDKAEKERLAKEKRNQEKLAAEKAEQQRKADLKAEEERAAEKAEKERLAKKQAEQERLATEKQEQERIAAEKAAMERLAQEKAAQEKLAAEKAEKQRQADLKAAEERRLVEKAEKERLAKQQAEEERVAAEKLEKERIAAEKAAMERVTREKAAQEKLAAEKAEKQRLADLKAQEERNQAEKAEKDRIAAKKTDKELAAQAATEAAARKEQARIAAERAELERLAQEKAAQEKLAAEKTAQQPKVTVTQPEEKPKAESETDQQRLAREELERISAKKSEQQAPSAVKEAEAPKAVEQPETGKPITPGADQDRLAVKKSEEEKNAAAAEAARLEAANREKERIASEKAAADAEAARLTASKEEKARAEKTALREKAIAQYKMIIEKYPGSKAAASAAAKLKGLGIAVALPPQKAEEQAENAQVLRLEVTQYAGFEFNLLAKPQPHEVARRVSIPFELTNRGNGNDSFYLESGFPAEFNAGFAAADAPNQAINQTPVLPPGAHFKGLVTVTIPASSIDGLKITYPVKAASRFMGEASQSREVAMIAAAPLLRAVLKTDKTQPLPGDKVTYRIALLNVGSTTATEVTFRLNFPPQLEPLDYAKTGFKQEMKAALVLEGLQIKSGENKEYAVTFQLKDDSLAGQELLTRGELVNNPLKSSSAFVSNASHVQPQHGIMVRAGSDKLVAIPGQTIIVPFVVTNTGNIREKFKITSTIKGAQDATIYLDLNRDGLRQASEPSITEVGPLAPKEEAGIIIAITTPRNASDGTGGSLQVAFSPEGDASRVATASTSLLYSRPVLQMAMAGREGRLRPGEIASYDLTVINRGSNIARVVELQSAWPELLELVAAEPSNSSVSAGNIIWKFVELGAGEKRTIKVSFRVKQGTGVGTNIQVKNVLKYEDQLGNRY